MRKLASVLFLLLAVTANLFAQVGPTSGGGGSVSSGTAIGSCTSSILYTDASTLLKCDPAAVVNGSVSTAGRSILTIQDTITGSSATSNFLNITGTFPATLSATTTGVNIALTGDDDNSAQNGLQVSLSSSGANPQNRITINSLLTGTFINNDALAIYGKNTATSAGNGFTVGARGEANGNAAGRWAGIMGYATSGNGNATATIGGYFAGVGTTSATTTSNYGVVSGAQSSGTNGIGGLFFLNATSNFDIAATAPSSLITATGKAALVADNGAVAANIFEARDNGTAVFTIADGGASTFATSARVPNGTAAAPPLLFDTATGLYAVSTGFIGIALGGGKSFGFTTSQLRASSTMSIGFTNANAEDQFNDTFFMRDAAAVMQLGADVNGAAVNQTLKAHDGITGTDVKGASLTLAPGLGTGAAVSNPLTLNRVVTKATGTTAQTYSPAIIACPTKILSNTSATAQTIATITTTSTTGGNVTMDYTTVANNGTLQDTDSGMVKVSWNNNAGTVAATMSAVALQSDQDASGTLATTPTATVATNVVSIKFTPTWVTIVPTTVTGWALFHLATSGDTVVCQ